MHVYVLLLWDVLRSMRKIWESEVQRTNHIYCVRRAEWSNSGVRCSVTCIFLKNLSILFRIIPFLEGFLLLYLILLFWKMEEGLVWIPFFKNPYLKFQFQFRRFFQVQGGSLILCFEFYCISLLFLFVLVNQIHYFDLLEFGFQYLLIFRPLVYFPN